MKRIYIYILLCLSILSGCTKDKVQLIDGKRSEQRLIADLNSYTEKLKGSTYGWKAYLYPKGGGGYSFYLSFDDKNRIKMYADINDLSATTSMESSYSVKANQIPVLSLDTYSYLHLLADPDNTVMDGAKGWGLYSDFEFSFMKESGDTVMLDGKLFKDTKLILIKATAAEQTAYNAKGLFNFKTTALNYIKANPNLYIDLGDANKIQTAFDYGKKVFSLTWIDGGIVSDTSCAFAFTLDGIVLKTALSYKGKNISGLLWDPVKKLFYTNVNGSRFEVMTSPTPILPLYMLMGNQFSTISVPASTATPGSGPDFTTRKAQVVAGIKAGKYAFTYNSFDFIFNETTKIMTVTVDLLNSATSYKAFYEFSFTKSPDGTYKFTKGMESGGAKWLLTNQMGFFFDDRILTDQFKLDYFTNQATGATLGLLKSVEHPDFIVSGTLK